MLSINIMLNIILSSLDDYLDYSLSDRLFWICSFIFFSLFSILLDLQYIKYVADARTLSLSTDQVFACQVYICEQTSWPWFENLGHIAPRIGVVIRLYTMTCCILIFRLFLSIKSQFTLSCVRSLLNQLYTIHMYIIYLHIYRIKKIAYISNEK